MFAFSRSHCIAAVLLVTILFVNKCVSLRCYSCTTCDSGGSFNKDAAEIIEDCGGSCTKRLFEDAIQRGCSNTVSGGEVCDAATTITMCYCKTDLCNSGSTFGMTLTMSMVVFSVLARLMI